MSNVIKGILVGRPFGGVQGVLLKFGDCVLVYMPCASVIHYTDVYCDTLGISAYVNSCSCQSTVFGGCH